MRIYKEDNINSTKELCDKILLIFNQLVSSPFSKPSVVTSDNKTSIRSTYKDKDSDGWNSYIAKIGNRAIEKLSQEFNLGERQHRHRDTEGYDSDDFYKALYKDNKGNMFEIEVIFRGRSARRYENGKLPINYSIIVNITKDNSSNKKKSPKYKIDREALNKLKKNMDVKMLTLIPNYNPGQNLAGWFWVNSVGNVFCGLYFINIETKEEERIYLDEYDKSDPILKSLDKIINIIKNNINKLIYPRNVIDIDHDSLIEIKTDIKQKVEEE